MDPGSLKDNDKKKKTLEEITDMIDKLNETKSSDKLKLHGIFDISQVNVKEKDKNNNKRNSEFIKSKNDSSSTLISQTYSNKIIESKGSTVQCSKRNSEIEMLEQDFLNKLTSNINLENPYSKKVKDSFKNVKESDFKAIREKFINLKENESDKGFNIFDLESNKDDIKIFYKNTAKNESKDISINSSTTEIFKIFNSPSFKISEIRKDSNTGSKPNENRKRSMN